MFTTNWHGDISTPNHEKYRHCEERSDAAIHGFGGMDCHAGRHCERSAAITMTMLFQGNQPGHPRQRGFTLIELIIFIVVVSIALAGILSVMNTVVKSSADPMVRKQAIALAESVLEEVMLQNYSDPDGTNTGETGHAYWDNVADYVGKTNVDLGVRSELSSYVVGIAVANDTSVIGTSLRPALRVTVTVTHSPEVITLIGYRACYGEISCP